MAQYSREACTYLIAVDIDGWKNEKLICSSNTPYRAVPYHTTPYPTLPYLRYCTVPYCTGPYGTVRSYRAKRDVHGTQTCRYFWVSTDSTIEKFL